MQKEKNLKLLFSVTYFLIFFFRIPTRFILVGHRFPVQAITYFFLALIGIYVYRKRFKEIGIWIRQNILKFSLFTGLAIVVDFLFEQILIPLLAQILRELFHLPEFVSQNENSLSSIIQHYPIFVVVVVVVFLGPITEEVFFRQYFLSPEVSTGKQFGLLVLSSFLFGMVHVHHFTGMELFYGGIQFLNGLVLGWIYLLSKKNIVLSILVHSLGNLLILLMM